MLHRNGPQTFHSHNFLRRVVSWFRRHCPSNTSREHQGSTQATVLSILCVQVPVSHSTASSKQASFLESPGHYSRVRRDRALPRRLLGSVVLQEATGEVTCVPDAEESEKCRSGVGSTLGPPLGSFEQAAGFSVLGAGRTPGSGIPVRAAAIVGSQRSGTRRCRLATSRPLGIRASVGSGRVGLRLTGPRARHGRQTLLIEGPSAV